LYGDLARVKRKSPNPVLQRAFRDFLARDKGEGRRKKQVEPVLQGLIGGGGGARQRTSGFGKAESF